MVNIRPDAACPYCRGTGIVTDWVDYGSTRVPMDSECDCSFDDEFVTDEEMRKIKDVDGVTLWYIPSNAPYSYCVFRDGFMIAEDTSEGGALQSFAGVVNLNPT